jgi:hypothetical protein
LQDENSEQYLCSEVLKKINLVIERCIANGKSIDNWGAVKKYFWTYLKMETNETYKRGAYLDKRNECLRVLVNRVLKDRKTQESLKSVVKADIFVHMRPELDVSKEAFEWFTGALKDTQHPDKKWRVATVMKKLN